MAYLNHTTTTARPIKLTVTAGAQREMHGDDAELAEETPAVLEAYAAFIRDIVQRKIDFDDLDPDGGVTVTADDVVVERELAWVPTVGDNGLTPAQQARYKRYCRTGLVDQDMPY